MQSDGTLRTYEGAEDPELTNLAHNHDILVIPYIVNEFDGERVHDVINNHEKMLTHIEIIVNKTVENSYDGINIDYESCYESDRYAFTRFVKNLAVALHNEGKILEISVHAKTSEPGNWNGPQSQDWKALASPVDYFRVMTYDYSWETSPPGAIAPIDWISEVTRFALTLVPPEKLVMGVPFYGYDWIGSEAASRLWIEVQDTISTYGITPSWDDSAKEPFFQYHDGSNTHTVYYQNFESTSYKTDLYYNYGVKGISIWHIGGEDPENWNSIRDTIGTVLRVESRIDDLNFSDLKIYCDNTVYRTPCSILRIGSHKLRTWSTWTINNTEYFFDRWEREDKSVISTNSHITYNLQGNGTIYAIYELKPLTEMEITIETPTDEIYEDEFTINMSIHNSGSSHLNDVIVKLLTTPDHDFISEEDYTTRISSLAVNETYRISWHITTTDKGTFKLITTANGIDADERTTVAIQRWNLTKR
jgi:hypothetical protein